jgi:hypothetical protein
MQRRVWLGGEVNRRFGGPSAGLRALCSRRQRVWNVGAGESGHWSQKGARLPNAGAFAMSTLVLAFQTCSHVAQLALNASLMLFVCTGCLRTVLVFWYITPFSRRFGGASLTSIRKLERCAAPRRSLTFHGYTTLYP